MLALFQKAIPFAIIRQQWTIRREVVELVDDIEGSYVVAKKYRNYNFPH